MVNESRPTQRIDAQAVQGDDVYAPPAREDVRGVHESTAIVSRGAAFAFPLYFLGRTMSGLFSSQTGVITGFSKRLTGGTFAAVGGVLGAYSGSRDAREGRQQNLRLQDTLARLDKQNFDLKQELKAQLSGEGTLREFKEEWEHPAVVEAAQKIDPTHDPDAVEKPQTSVETHESSHEDVIKADAKKNHAVV